jgi:hypothetical protein
MPRLNKLLPVLLLATCAAKKPKGPPPPPPVGWHQAAGWSAACYNPPAFGELGLVDRRSARDDALRALMDQWHGQRNDGVQFDDKVIETVETVMLGIRLHDRLSRETILLITNILLVLGGARLVFVSLKALWP